MKLPLAISAIVEPGKITNYLLNPRHPKGAAKAAFFQAFGFTLEAIEQFAQALLAHGKTNDVVKVRESEYGKLYTVRCSCPTPDERNPCIDTVWEVTVESATPRLVTAYPA